MKKPYSMEQLTVFHNLNDLPLVQQLSEMLLWVNDETDGFYNWANSYGRAFYELAQEGYDDLGKCLSDHLFYDESPYAMAMAKHESTPALRMAASFDLALLNTVLAMPWAELAEKTGMPLWNSSPLPTLEELDAFYNLHGCGKFARHQAFVWQFGKLHPVKEPDSVPETEMLGYQRQRDQVAANTRALLAGHRVNNMLLYGASGTGKSATVKSLLNMKGMENLRLIEVDKSDLAGMPDLVRMLGHQPQKFILFIDDLAFDKDDHNYSILKTILEGGVEPRPVNVAVYATSNRRHLVRETFSDRNGDEVDARETIYEKTSLAERFGIRVLYHELSKPEFMAMISDLARIKGIVLDYDKLMALAVRWDIRNPNRTPRSAVQFIDSLSMI